MMEFLRLLDQEILLIFNGYHTEFLDAVMWHVSHRFFWIPFYAILLAMMVMKFGWLNSLRYLICIGIIITLADQICASVLRPMFERMRPSNPDNPFSAMVTLTYGYHGGRYGFPSCHAANTMALATFISLVFRSRKLIVIMAVWSVVVSCSRTETDPWTPVGDRKSVV